MTDIVERLRVNMHAYGIAQEAADEIERLRAEVAYAGAAMDKMHFVRMDVEAEAERLRELLLLVMSQKIMREQNGRPEWSIPVSVINRIDAALKEKP